MWLGDGACAVTTSAPRRVPSRRDGSRCNNLRNKSFNSALVTGTAGNSNAWWMMLWNVCSRRLARKGVTPNTISWMKIPNSHQSMLEVCPVLFSTSGARYSSVPTKLRDKKRKCQSRIGNQGGGMWWVGNTYLLVNANGSATIRG